MKALGLVIVLVTASLLITSCNSGPKPIDYGNDGCHYCKMTIVDKIHGSEIVTEKGKIFKFDATECMLSYAEDKPELENATFYTNYYENPSGLIPAMDATFLISEKIPSPMGANLTAFQNKNSAVEILTEQDGKIYTWEKLKTHLKLKENRGF